MDLRVFPKGLGVEFRASVLKFLSKLDQYLSRLILKHGAIKEPEDLLFGIWHCREHGGRLGCCPGKALCPSLLLHRLLLLRVLVDELVLKRRLSVLRRLLLDLVWLVVASGDQLLVVAEDHLL